ncbi:MAG: MarR family transcriptional regulator [Acidimicrobiales bacterium]
MVEGDDETLELVARLRLAVARLNRQLRAQSANDLTLSMQSALFTVSREGPLTLGALALREQVAPSMVTKLLDRLERDGLVERTAHATDKRVKYVAATDLGHERTQQIRRRREAWLATRVSSLGPDDVARLDAAIDVLEALSEPDEPGS